MASPPTARPASPARTESSWTGFARSVRVRRRDDCPSPARRPARSGARRSRSVASCRQVRDWVRCRRSRFQVRAPCRRSGRSRALPAGFPDASGRYRSCRPARFRPCARRARDIFPDRRRISCGSRPSRNNRCVLYSRGDAWRCADRPSCRRPDPTRRLRANDRDRGRDDRDLRVPWCSVLRKIPLGGI